MKHATHKEKKERNDENIRQVIAVLAEANYHCGRQMKDRDGCVIEVWVGAGRANVVVLQLFANDDGFEVYTPIIASLRMDETLEALRKATKRVATQ